MTTTVRESQTVAGQADALDVIAPPSRTSRLRRVAVRRSPRRPAPPLDGSRLVVSTTLTMLSLLCLWQVLQLVVLGGFSQGRSQDLLYGEFRSQVAQGIAPLGPVTPAGDPVAVISIPALELEQTVVEGTTSADTTRGPGHLRNTVLPGQVGTSVVMGRSQTYGAPFGDLAALVPGDTITVTSAQGALDFSVISVRRAGDEIPQPLAAGAARLVLLTSQSQGGASSLSAGAALYVDADAPEGFGAPAGLPATVPESERPLQGDPGALPLLVLYLAGLLAVCLGIVWARQRQSAGLVWVVGAPIAVAMTWATTDVAVRLLPNLL